MGSQKNTITINGKQYDINSGQLLVGENIVRPQPLSPPKNNTIQPNSNRIVDGIKPIKRTAPKRQSENIENRSNTESLRAPINPAKRNPARANTLARTFVKKPPKLARETKEKDLYPKKIELRRNLDAQRLIRANDIQLNNKVSKFGNSSISEVKKTVNNIEVVPEPINTNSSYDIADIPPTSINTQFNQRKTKANDLFDKALLSSSSHKQEFKDDKSSNRRKITGLTSVVLAVVLISGFVIYQYIPNLSLSSASSKIGFQATIPRYKPSGFGLEGSIKYQLGKVVLNFRSNSDDRNYTIEQTKSELDSESLLNNFVITKNREYQTEIANGRTVYIYDGLNATWVDGGIWYKLDNSANLPKEQILKIVSSI